VTDRDRADHWRDWLVRLSSCFRVGDPMSNSHVRV
jgi:hypothetical protein